MLLTLALLALLAYSVNGSTPLDSRDHLLYKKHATSSSLHCTPYHAQVHPFADPSSCGYPFCPTEYRSSFAQETS